MVTSRRYYGREGQIDCGRLGGPKVEMDRSPDTRVRAGIERILYFSVHSHCFDHICAQQSGNLSHNAVLHPSILCCHLFSFVYYVATRNWGDLSQTRKFSST